MAKEVVIPMISMDDPREVAVRLAKEAFAKCRGKLFFLPDGKTEDIHVVASEILAIEGYWADMYNNRIYTPEATLLMLERMSDGWNIDVTKDIQEVDNKFKGKAIVHIRQSEHFSDEDYGPWEQYEDYSIYASFTRLWGSPEWVLDRFRGNR